MAGLAYKFVYAGILITLCFTIWYVFFDITDKEIKGLTVEYNDKGFNAGFVDEKQSNLNVLFYGVSFLLITILVFYVIFSPAVPI